MDDARAHISTIKMLRNFHYIDEKGKDQGINGVLIQRDPGSSDRANGSAQPC